MCAVSNLSGQGCLQKSSKSGIHRDGPGPSEDQHTMVLSTCRVWEELAVGAVLQGIFSSEISIKVSCYVLFIAWS